VFLYEEQADSKMKMAPPPVSVSRPSINYLEEASTDSKRARYIIEYPLIADTAFQEGTTAAEFRKDMAILKENLWIDQM
jgi:hypothetical protein